MKKHSILDDFSLPRLIFEISAIQQLDANRTLRRFNLTLEQAYIIFKLIDAPASQKEISEKTMKDQANTTRILKRLTEKNLVKIVPSEKDKRVNIVSLTQEGTDLINKMLPHLNELQCEFLSFFPEEEIDQLIENLMVYLKKFTENPEILKWREKL